MKVFCVSWFVSDHGLAAESFVTANLSERVQLSDNKSLPLSEETDLWNFPLTDAKLQAELKRLSGRSESLHVLFDQYLLICV